MELQEYFRILRRRGWIILLVAAIAAVSAFVYSKAQPVIYKASIELTVLPARSDYGQSLVVKNLIRNYARQLQTHDMAQVVIDNLQLDIPAPTLLGKLIVSANDADLTIQIDVKDRDTETAWAIARTLSEVFIAQNDERNLEQDKRDRIDVEILDTFPNIVLHSPKTKINTLAGLILGALCGAVIVFVLEWLEADILSNAEDVERYVGTTVLGMIPVMTTEDVRATGSNRYWQAIQRRLFSNP